MENIAVVNASHFVPGSETTTGDIASAVVDACAQMVSWLCPAGYVPDASADTACELLHVLLVGGHMVAVAEYAREAT